MCIPCEQYLQELQGLDGEMATKSPSLKLLTFFPIYEICPDTSWPSIIGSFNFIDPNPPSW